MKNIVLTGFMASGKTTVGMRLSQKLNYKYFDTDAIIEENEKKSINEIFGVFGEEYFRKLENEVSNSFSKISDAVISTGGGFVLNPENIDNLRENSVVFNLNVSRSILLKRYDSAKPTRPLMDSVEAFLERYEKRKEFYKNCDISVDIDEDKTPDEICDIIIEKYNEFIG